MTGYLLEIGQALLALLLAPGLVGFIRWLKARLQGRRGAMPWQPYHDLRKLFGKEVVMSKNASWLFRFAPYVIFATAVAVTLLVPLVAAPLPFDAVGDLLVVVYLLLLGTFFLALAGLDPGTSFGGMGASREVTVAAIAEPTIALAIFGLAVGAGSTNLGRIVAQTLSNPGAVINPGHLLGFTALFVVMIAETGRLPVDNPSTHLELTMIHEAMILEYSGRYLALIEWAAALKLLLYISLLAAVFAPFGMATADSGPLGYAIGLALYFAKLVIGAGLLALFEISIAKMRVFRVPEFLGAALMLGLLATILQLVSRSL